MDSAHGRSQGQGVHDGGPHDGGTPNTRRAPIGEHPGVANYPVNGSAGRSRSTGARNAYLPPPTRNPHLPPLDGESAPGDTDRLHSTRAMGSPGASNPIADETVTQKITVSRVVAARWRELGGRGIGKIQQAATADGADESGLTALTLPVIANYAVDAAMAVALANTLFFAAATGESKANVALYLMLTIAPFALIAPLIGPLLDRLQHGRRIAMAATFGARVVLALLIMSNTNWNPDTQQLHYDPWVLYPCALGLLVLSKSFGVLKSAVTPRVVPPSIDLPRVNSRLTMWGLVAGTIIGGAVAALFELLLAKALPFHIPGAMAWLAVIAAYGAYLCMRIPSWVEVTEGEIPTTLTYHGEPATRAPENDATGSTPGSRAKEGAKALAAKMRQPLGRKVVTGLWGNATIRILTGFLTLYIAFYAKSQQTGSSAWMQLALLGMVGAAAGVGNAIGTGIGTRMELKNPPQIIVWSTVACFVGAVLTAIFGNIALATVAAFIASGTSAIGKVCLDSSIQTDLPDESRASAFGRSETVLQLSWVFGASLGVLLPTTLWIGFTVVSVMMSIGLLQTVLTARGTSLVPGIGGRRPDYAQPTVAIDVSEIRRRTAPQPPSAAPTRPQPAPRAHPSTDSPTDPTGPQ